jgi:hypothetical protein
MSSKLDPHSLSVIERERKEIRAQSKRRKN